MSQTHTDTAVSAAGQNESVTETRDRVTRDSTQSQATDTGGYKRWTNDGQPMDKRLKS